MKDTIYKETSEPIKPFEFNQRVVDVFPDMIARSVPGYPLTISMMSVMANDYIQEGSHVYDLGCSLGAVSLAIQQGLKEKQCKIIAADNSKAMIDDCVKNISCEHIEFVQDDILNIEIRNASLVVMNFTLQFIPLEQRNALLKKICQGLLPGGALILSEKIKFDNKAEDKTMNQLHHAMKELNGYDKLEIASKREALENVLVPETIDTHLQRLNDSGFDNVFMWLKCFSFASLVAIK
ncbi:MAG: carboxy-S-adenosyl-L-methionine synthase CmoA [Proteobacteria bacterium]|nr:carboxy-S-adenosyl-L-methionine synthase CmoA [Pseudomonadota bacterium]NOG59287.1 carboxy-S-adenosyl-L-methionine synthase CmoA [Pseudomonadota bacterium]